MKRLGINLDQQIQRTKKRFIEADTKNDVYYALLSLQRLLHDAHSNLTAPQELIPRSANVILPFTLAVRGDALANAQYVVGTSSLPELKPGFVLKEYQDKSIAQLEYDYIEWLDSSSSEILKMELARALTRAPSTRRIPEPDVSLPVVATFIDPNTKTEIKITTTWRSAMPAGEQDDYASFTADYRGIHYQAYKGIANDTLIVVYTSFNYTLSDADLKSALTRASFPVPAFDQSKPLAEQRDWLIQFLRANEYPDAERQIAGGISLTGIAETMDILTLGKYLNRQTVANVLVDVRNNSGGNVNVELIRLFATQPFTGTARAIVYTPLVRSDNNFFEGALTYADSRMKPIILDQVTHQNEATQSRAFPWYCKSGSCAPSEGVFNPNSAIRKFNFAVLVGPLCTSACEHFVATTQDNRLGKVVGLPSRGGSAPFRAAKSFVLKNGQTFSIILNTGISYRPNGEPLEGNPAPVDYYLFPEDDYVSKMIAYLKANGGFK